MSVNGAVSSLHAEAGSRPPFTISIAKLLRVAAASYIFTRLLSRFSSGRRGNDVESHSAWIFLEIFEYLYRRISMKIYCKCDESIIIKKMIDRLKDVI